MDLPSTGKRHTELREEGNHVSNPGMAGQDGRSIEGSGGTREGDRLTTALGVGRGAFSGIEAEVKPNQRPRLLQNPSDTGSPPNLRSFGTGASFALTDGILNDTPLGRAEFESFGNAC